MKEQILKDKEELKKIASKTGNSEMKKVIEAKAKSLDKDIKK